MVQVVAVGQGPGPESGQQQEQERRMEMMRAPSRGQRVVRMMMLMRTVAEVGAVAVLAAVDCCPEAVTFPSGAR